MIIAPEKFLVVSRPVYSLLRVIVPPILLAEIVAEYLRGVIEPAKSNSGVRPAYLGFGVISPFILLGSEIIADLFLGVREPRYLILGVREAERCRGVKDAVYFLGVRLADTTMS